MKVPRDTNPRLKRFARRLRAESTDAERRMWMILRHRKLAGWKFRRQYPVAGYVVDFYCIKARLAIELDGGQHLEANQAEYDEKRTKLLEQLGMRVLRFWDNDALKDTDLVAEAIYNALVGEEPSPLPSPGVPGEGGGQP